MIQILTHSDWMILAATECSSFRKTGRVFFWHIQESLGGLPQKERTGMFVRNFEKNPGGGGYQDPIVWGWLAGFFLPLKRYCF